MDSQTDLIEYSYSVACDQMTRRHTQQHLNPQLRRKNASMLLESTISLMQICRYYANYCKPTFRNFTKFITLPRRYSHIKWYIIYIVTPAHTRTTRNRIFSVASRFHLKQGLEFGSSGLHFQGTVIDVFH